MEPATCLIVLVGIFVGAAGGWLVARSRNARELAEIAGVNARLDERSKQVAQLEHHRVRVRAHALRGRHGDRREHGEDDDHPQ